ncbi:MAG: hypothetical protein KF871_01270 [Hydrogenophaga sp.]|uniref:VOC family protein n=1 Tax=Hydrogenophaga sp. TaxID=1904254 RepID=UPI001D68F4AB|nr:hypothetical protein [Hydrogenophaga sp.]MBX3608499.1 hypothetical protein [Hydrogenophaga sp.]
MTPMPVLTTPDLRRAIAFYRERVGLHCRQHIDGVVAWLGADGVPDARFALCLMASAAPPARFERSTPWDRHFRASAHRIAVHNLWGLVEGLRGLSLPRWQTWGAWTSLLHDADGHTLHLCERQPASHRPAQPSAHRRAA